MVQNTTSMEARIRQADLGEAPALAALQRWTDLIAYDSISPPEAPKPDLDQMTLDWHRVPLFAAGTGCHPAAPMWQALVGWIGPPWLGSDHLPLCSPSKNRERPQQRHGRTSA